MSTTFTVNTTYEPFSREPEYLEANRGFVEIQPMTDVVRFLDLACGTGVVSKMLLEACPAAHFNGVDYDPVQIRLATEELSQAGYTVRQGLEITDEVANGKPVLVFGVSSADELPFADETFDCVTIANAIHMMPDKQKFLAEVHRVLRPGGLFGFNSLFYAGSYPEGTEKHFYEWLRLATLHIERLNRQLQSEGKPPIKRVRGTSHRAFQNRWFSSTEWAQELEIQGLLAHTIHERVAELDERCFATIGAYGGLAEVLLSGYPVEVASIALQSTAKESLEACGATSIPRKWLEMWATKN
jgi:ubiquinone/menaquinone biosynthesis C-methylase UbiE